MQFNGGLHSPYFVFANSLDSLRTLTKQDQHSISVNPYYKKTTFLDHHSNSIHLKNKGIHVPLVKTDIDGQPRNTLMPDIGADEIDLTADVVWPGDADADSKVTGRDLLSLGLYTGETGFTRTTVNNEWLPQESVDWNKNQYNMANLKHADCNGDGIVDANDTLAVSQNFGLVHNKNSRLAANNQVMSAGNDLHFIVTNPKKQFKNMEKINVEIWLGKAASTANDVYGISFDVAFLNRYVANGTFKMVANDSWLGTVSKSGMNTYSLTSKDESIGMAYAAVVRNDHKNASGYGKIASFSFLFTDPAGSNAPLSEDLFLLFQNAVLINASGNELTVTPHNNSITNYVGDITTGISTESTNALSVTIVPNPFSGYARLNYVLENDAATELEISNVLGKVVYTMFKGTQRAGKHEFQIDTKEMGLSSGMYFISLTVGKQKITNKVVITD